MNKSRFELPEERLATTDEKGRRLFLYPADVRGFFQKIRKPVHFILMLIFLVLPWVKVGGYQSVLLDIPQRRFAFFGITFWAHDAPMLIFVFLTVFFGIAFITVVWGRLWCGWACPETVFIESVYRRIERWIEGDAVQRRLLDQAPWSSKKISLKSIKWIFFTLVTLIITHSFLAYFVGTERLMLMVTQNPAEHPVPFLIMAALSGILLFAFGSFREQFCIIMCPYGRLQAALMDKNSLAIVYDQRRGEPRRGLAIEKKQEGDCINCYRCVQVCPTGVDIRRGVQLECIACTACVDACDEVMLKVNKPKGLVRYDTENRLEGKPSPFFRAKMVIYGLVAVISTVSLFVFISLRNPVDITILKAREMPYQRVSEGMISNHFQIFLSNKTFEPQVVQVYLSEAEVEKGVELVMIHNPIPILPGEDFRGDFFVKFPKEGVIQKGRGVLEIIVLGEKTTHLEAWQVIKELRVLGPF